MSSTSTFDPLAVCIETRANPGMRDALEAECDPGNGAIASKDVSEDSRKSRTVTNVQTFKATVYYSITAEGLKCYWDDIPFEVRAQIFDHLDDPEDEYPSSEQTLAFEWDGITPATLKSLRPLPVAHNHALQYFAPTDHRQGGRTLMALRTPCYMDLNRAELHAIKTLFLDVSNVALRGYGYPQERFEKPTWFTKECLKMKNVRTVHIYMDSWFVTDHNVQTFLTEFPFWLQGFKALTRAIVEIPNGCLFRASDHEHERLLNMRGVIMRGTTRKTGVQGQLVPDLWNRVERDGQSDIWVCG